MAKVNSILDQRMKKPSNTSKMAAMALQSATGNLTSFSGMFSVTELSEKEKENLATLLKNYANSEHEIGEDLNFLISLTSEVKAINNQAALLHGERIKKAHHILTSYREGAFSAWLVAAYGNRQTPYNLMQYYEFCEAMPRTLRPKIEWMPRQAVYVLATRAGSLEKKQKIVEKYEGETKAETLTLIREHFPLEKNDRRATSTGKNFIRELDKIRKMLQKERKKLGNLEKQEILSLLKEIQHLIEE